MLKEAIGTGATVDLAKADAIAQLGISADSDFEIEVLEMPTKKMFGLLGTTPAKVKVSYDAPSEAGAKEYLEKILASLGIEGAEIKIEETDEEVSIAVEYDGDYGAAIGRRGETLDAIQYLVRLVVNRGADKSRRVSLNIGNYREKREATLRALAQKSAAKVRKYGRNVVLDPMNPYERRVIHSAISKIEGVSSRSVGEEPYRKIIVSSNNPRYNNRRRDNRRDGSRNDRRNDRKGGDREVTMERKSVNLETSFEKDYKRPKPEDNIEGGLYGKIEF